MMRLLRWLKMMTYLFEFDMDIPDKYNWFGVDWAKGDDQSGRLLLSKNDMNPPRGPAVKTFTLTEARRALPYVRRVVRDIVATYAIVSLLKEIHDTEPENYEEKYYARMDRLSDLCSELEAVGVEVKDFQTGCVDFPSKLYGTAIFLCWTLGEDDIQWYHFMGDGIGQRKRIYFD